MSNELNIRTDETAGELIRARAAQWVIARREHEAWSESDQNELDTWLAQSPAHTVAYLRIESAWDRANRLAALRTPPSRTFMDRAIPLILRIAAALTALAVVSFVVHSLVPSKPGQKAYSTSIGGGANITLADGSQIELNTNTAIRISDATSDRMVWLDRGEAYFSVKHDPTHPLIVIVKGHRIVDIGTKFLVREDGSHVRVSLVEGSVDFESADGKSKTGARLKPGDILVATANSVSVTRVPVAGLADELSWRNGLVVFKHTTLSEAVAEINRYGRKKLEIADPELGDLKISGAFPVNDIELFARVARVALGVRIEDRRNALVISRK